MNQLPSYVTAVPDGSETGLYFAVDLGGTNLRVCSVDLHGDTTFSILQSEVAIPSKLMIAKTSRELFSFVANHMELFLRMHHKDLLRDYHAYKITCIKPEAQHVRSVRLGFTFSFAVEQQALNRGTLLRWTKGFNIPDAVVEEVCSLLQAEMDRLNLPVLVVALVNDTVGTLLARSYSSPGNTKTLLGAIFGTGTNGAYVEQVHNITKLKPLLINGSGEMIVNTEWGSFDNELAVLPNTSYDQAVDAESTHTGIQMFEKRTSGMYLGEILRHAILAMITNTTSISVSKLSALNQQFVIDASFLSTAAADKSAELVTLKEQLKLELGVDATTEIAKAVKIMADAIGERAARLAGVAIAGVILKSSALSASPAENRSRLRRPGTYQLQLESDLESGRSTTTTKSLSSTRRYLPIFALIRILLSFVPKWGLWLLNLGNRHKDARGTPIVDIGVDGSLFQFYPGFEHKIRSTLRDVEGIGFDGEKRVRIGLARDGSGVGAALVARMAEKGRKPIF